MRRRSLLRRCAQPQESPPQASWRVRTGTGAGLALGLFRGLKVEEESHPLSFSHFSAKNSLESPQDFFGRHRCFAEVRFHPVHRVTITRGQTEFLFKIEHAGNFKVVKDSLDKMTACLQLHLKLSFLIPKSQPRIIDDYSGDNSFPYTVLR
jgi:hypothetical protein